MSLIFPAIANFLSEYGNALARIFNTDQKIPLVCLVNPDGSALGGAGSVGNDEFLANFVEAAGGPDAVKAFDVSARVPIVCVVNPDGTAFTGVQDTTRRYSIIFTAVPGGPPVVSHTEINTTGGDVALGYTTSGFYSDYALTFTFPPGVLANKGKVKVLMTLNGDVSEGFYEIIPAYAINGDVLNVWAWNERVTPGYCQSFGNPSIGEYCVLDVTIFS